MLGRGYSELLSTQPSPLTKDGLQHRSRCHHHRLKLFLGLEIHGSVMIAVSNLKIWLVVVCQWILFFNRVLGIIWSCRMIVASWFWYLFLHFTTGRGMLVEDSEWNAFSLSLFVSPISHGEWTLVLDLLTYCIDFNVPLLISYLI